MKGALTATGILLLMALIGVGSRLMGGPPPRLEAGDWQDYTPFAPFDLHIRTHAFHLLEDGRDIFRFDTFGNEAFWGGQLRLHEAIADASPGKVLALGLKVDVAALPPPLLAQLRKGQVNLADSAVTLDLLQRNAVVGVTGFFRGKSLQSMGIQCALCPNRATTDSVG